MDEHCSGPHGDKNEELGTRASRHALIYTEPLVLRDSITSGARSLCHLADRISQVLRDSIYPRRSLLVPSSGQNIAGTAGQYNFRRLKRLPPAVGLYTNEVLKCVNYCEMIESRI